ncbi:unnamed protein product [Phytomonas sp. EM1]|nr:unnamed protein product [Phytomonas sp. EM1]|eukprot:CCW63178.1 unnamed protein product [Phytomonas sp. isolate EM1]
MRKEQGWLHKPDSHNLGGPCIVAMVNAAQLTSHLNCKVKYYGAFGNDDTAKIVIDVLKKTPIDISNLRLYDNRESSCAFCLSDPNYANGAGERCFIVDTGVLGTLSSDMIISEDFFKGDILFFGATALMPLLHQELTSLLCKGKQKGKINVVATVYDQVNETKHPHKRWPMGKSDDSFKYMDLLMVDMDEALGISGKTNVKDAIDFFVEKGVKAFTITHGSNNGYAWSDGTLFKKMDLHTFPICQKIVDDITANPSKRGDTTGCGDNFSGAILAYIAESLEKGKTPGELDLREAISWGVAAGGFACFSVGGTYLEKEKGEKRRLIEYYRRHYISQMKSSKL